MIEVNDKNLVSYLDNQASQKEVTDPDLINHLESKIGNDEEGFSYQLPGMDRVNPYKDIFEPAVALGSGALKGGSELGYGLASLLTGGYAPKPDFSSLQSVKDNPGLYTTGNIMGSLALGVPEYNAALSLGKMGPGAAELASRSPLISNIIQNVGAGATLGGLSSPDNRMMGMAQGGTLGAIFPAIGGISQKVAEGLTGRITPEMQPLNEALERSGISGQLPVPYKTGNNFIQKQYENVLSNIPGSGVLEDMKKMGKTLDKNTEELKSSFGSSTMEPEEIKKGIINDINTKFKINDENHNVLYKDLSDTAKNAGVSITLPNYKQSLIDVINKSKDPSSQALLQEPPSEIVSSAQKALQGFEKIGDEPLSFDQATKADAQLNKRIKDAYASDNLDVANFYKAQQSALRKDIEQSVNDSGNPELMQKWTNAKQNFAQNVAPFFDDAFPLAKYIGQKDEGKLSDQLLSDLVKTGKNGNPSQLQKVLSLIPNLQDKLGYLHLTSGRIGNESTPELSRILSNYKNLSPSVAKTLYSPDKLQKLQDLNTINSGLGTLPQVLHNVNTGQKTNATNVLKTVLGGGLLSAYAAGGPIGAAAYIPSIMGLARGANRALSSKLANDIALGQTNFNLTGLSAPSVSLVPYMSQE